MTQRDQSDSREANEEEVRHMRAMIAAFPAGTRHATLDAIDRGGYTEEGCVICSAIRKAAVKP